MVGHFSAIFPKLPWRLKKSYQSAGAETKKYGEAKKYCKRPTNYNFHKNALPRTTFPSIFIAANILDNLLTSSPYTSGS